MSSVRAEEVAEVLWELKRAGKLATQTSIARRAGFSPGSNGRTILSCLRTVQRDWPHLEWWRVIRDDGTIDPEQSPLLEEAGFAAEPGSDGSTLRICDLEAHLMAWAAE